MTKAQAKMRIEQLRKTIRKHRYLYHVKDTQEISDEALDSLKHELAELEGQYPELITPDSPTQRVAGKPSEKFNKRKHETPMRSLHDVFTFEELQKWEEQLRKLQPTGKFTYFAEVKMDGLALELEYEKGVLAYATTRGDGVTGEDVTTNARTIDAIPLKLHLEGVKDKTLRKQLETRVVVRGEVYMRKDVFEALNKQLKKQGKKLIANPRNGAAGSIRQLDPKLTASRRLDFMAYDVPTDLGLTTHESVHHLLSDLGFATAKANKTCKDLKAVQQMYDQLIKERDALPYWTDGVVVNVNDAKLFDVLGTVGKGPRGARAWKYPAEEATTVLHDVTVQVGRHGVLTPVAELEPVLIGGTTVKRASLHNYDEIKRLGLKIGDTVIVKKAGDVIPKVVGIVKDMRSGKEMSIRVPKTCPVCGGDVKRPKGEVNSYCVNKACVSRDRERFYHFVSKSALDIDGLGPKILDKLFEANLISTFADLYKLKQEDIELLEGFKETSAKNVIDAIEQKKHIPLHRFIIALGIRHTGAETAYDIAKRFKTLNGLRKATLEEIEAIPHIGNVVADSVYSYLQSEAGGREIDALLNAGVIVQPMEAEKGNVFDGMTIVVTGTLKEWGRDEIKELIRSQGGNPSGSISKKTDLVIIGENPGSKYTKAKELGIPTLDEKGLNAKLSE